MTHRLEFQVEEAELRDGMQPVCDGSWLNDGQGGLGL